MNLKVAPLALSVLGLVCAVAAVPASATVAPPPPADTYTYNINIPDLSDAGSAQFTFSTTNGWFGDPSSAWAGFSYSGSPLADGSLNLVSTTSGSSQPGGDNDLTEILLDYTDGSGNSAAFAFLENAAFWGAPGSALSFNNGAAGSAYGLIYQDPSDLTSQTWGFTNTGASFTTWLNGVQTDPPCDSCSITIDAEPPVTDTPEPGSLLLFGSGLLGLAGMVRRKIGLRA
jgi:hypothetical protein